MAIYILLLWDFTATYSNRKYKYTLEYNGLAWVAADMWLIWKYECDEKPMSFIKFTIEPI